jgi:antirestriction protein ArdC
MRKDVYQTITDQIIGELEKGVRPWLKQRAIRRGSFESTADLVKKTTA